MGPRLAEVGGIAYRELGDPDDRPIIFVHGYPESSYIWRNVMAGAAEAGWRALGPDLPGFGDSDAQPPGTWERQIEHLERFRAGLGLGPVALVVHDWGGLIGLRWACDNPELVRALVISNSGFFPEGRWHDFAAALRRPDEGEQLVENVTRELLATFLRQASPELGDDVIDECWKAWGDADRRRGQLELYRSGDFEKLEPYRGKLAALGVPTLLLWGGRDQFAPVGGAYRLNKQIPHAELVVVDDAGHFLAEDAPERFREELSGFLRRI